MIDVGRPPAPEKEFDIDAALELLRNKIRQIKRFFPNVDTTNLEESLRKTEEDLRQHARHVAHPGSSPGEDSPSVRQAKAMFRQVTLEDMRVALAEVRRSHPKLSIEHRMEILMREQPELVQAAQRMEEGE
jgi:hypothetical protein